MKIQDVFYITGRGYVIATMLEEDSVIRAGDVIEIDGTESYTVVAIERYTNALGPSKNIGILIRGQMKREKRSSYYGSSIVIKP